MEGASNKRVKQVFVIDGNDDLAWDELVKDLTSQVQVESLRAENEQLWQQLYEAEKAFHGEVCGGSDSHCFWCAEDTSLNAFKAIERKQISETKK